MKKILLSTLFILTCSIAFSQITLTSTVTNVSCYGGSDGSATISVSGGTPPYSYSCSTISGNSPTLNGLSAGIYTVNVIDAMANANTLTVTILQPQLLNIVTTHTNTTCNGTCDGAINLFVTGGIPPYMYNWSIGNVTQNQTALCAGVYSVSVTDINGCVSNSTDTINSGVSPNLTVNSGSFCSGNGSTTLSASGANSYTWTPAVGLNSTNGSSVIASPITTTIYTVTGSIGSCTSSASAQVTVYPSPTVSFSITQNATPHVWDITPNYSGGSGPYTYIWSFGDGSPNSTIPYPSHTYTTAGWYNICVTITDINGCSSTNCQIDSLYRMNSNNSMITVNVIDGLTTNVNQNTINNNSVSIYPNPTNSILNIIDNQNQLQNSTIKIKNYLGEIIFNSTFNNKIDISHFTSGLYFLTIEEKEYKKTIKIIKD